MQHFTVEEVKALARKHLTVEDVKALVSTRWTIEDCSGADTRIITRVENAHLSPYDHKTVLADIYWKRPFGRERSRPTPYPTFRTWLNKAKKVENSQTNEA